MMLGLLPRIAQFGTAKSIGNLFARSAVTLGAVGLAAQAVKKVTAPSRKPGLSMSGPSMNG